MSALIAHAKAARSMAEAFAFEANEPRNRTGIVGDVLLGISAAYSRAAADIEAKARSEASGEAGEIAPTPSGSRRGR